MPTARKVCSTPGCPSIVLFSAGRCADCRAKADKARGTPAQRGYKSSGHKRFRSAVLARDPVCVECKVRPSQHADHWPVSKRELIARGLDSNDPFYGRGLCAVCHSKATAASPSQRGGWNA